MASDQRTSIEEQADVSIQIGPYFPGKMCKILLKRIALFSENFRSKAHYYCQSENEFVTVTRFDKSNESKFT